MSVLLKTKKRLKTIKNLNSIFTALQVITMARLQKLKLKHKNAQQYLWSIREIAEQLDFSECMAKEKQTGRLAILISANRGFCGAFNQNVLFRSQNFIKEHNGEAEFIVFGRKGLEFLRAKKHPPRDQFLAEDYAFDFFFALMEKALRGRSEIHVIFNRFSSVVRQDAVALQIFPLAQKSTVEASRYLVEPSRRAAAQKALKLWLAAEIYFAYLDSQLGEIYSRIFTLKGAIENSKEIIQNLTMGFNKARQQLITRDLLEIVGSSEWLEEWEGY